MTADPESREPAPAGDGRERVDEADATVHERRLRGQREAFEAAIDGAPLPECLAILGAIAVDEMHGEARTAFYIAERDMSVLHPVVGAGTMPDAYTEQVDWFRIGTDSLACGLATATGRPVVTPDVAAEPDWQPWIHLAEDFQFRGCWSFPIETRDRRPIGTFAMYFPQPRDASADDLAMASVVTQAAGILIARDAEVLGRTDAERALRDSDARYRALFEAMGEGFVICKVVFDAGRPVDIRIVDANPAAVRMAGVDLVGRDLSAFGVDTEPHWLEAFGAVATSGDGQRRELPTRGGDAVYSVYLFRTDLVAPHHVAAIYADVTERHRAEERRALLVRELNHRVKNTLATVQAIANQTFDASSAPGEFVDTFQARLQALANAHGLLTRHSWDGADIVEVLRGQLLVDGEGERITLRGPNVRLGAETTLALALVLHELGTNARKYGALSAPDGHVHVEWRWAPESPTIELGWSESGGPSVRSPGLRGFGSTLIERSLRSVGGAAQLRFDPAGVRCALQIPIVGDD